MVHTFFPKTACLEMPFPEIFQRNQLKFSNDNYDFIIFRVGKKKSMLRMERNFKN